MTATRRSDAALAAAVVLVVVAASLVVDASLSLPWLLVGAAGTIGFEAVAMRRARAVRRRWERRSVQFAVLVLALTAIAIGAVVAPSIVLSAAAGALATYLAILGLAAVRDRWPSTSQGA